MIKIENKIYNIVIQCHYKMAGWQSGYAAACKAVHSGSIPDSASSIMIFIRKEKNFYMPEWWNW